MIEIAIASNSAKDLELEKTESVGSLSSCSEDVALLPDVAFSLAASSCTDSAAHSRESQPLLAREDHQPLNYIPGNISLSYGDSFSCTNCYH